MLWTVERSTRTNSRQGAQHENTCAAQKGSFEQEGALFETPNSVVSVVFF